MLRCAKTAKAGCFQNLAGQRMTTAQRASVCAVFKFPIAEASLQPSGVPWQGFIPAPPRVKRRPMRGAPHHWCPSPVRKVFGGSSLGNLLSSPPSLHTKRLYKEQQDRRRLVTAMAFFNFGKKASTLPEIVQAGDPVLHEAAVPVDSSEIGTPDLEQLIETMVNVMRAAPGVGLAAPQIGVNKQVIVVEDKPEYMNKVDKTELRQQEREPSELLVVINPKLTKKGTRTAIFFEGCLSVNGYRALVERHTEVEVTGMDQSGKAMTVRARGWLARILQHECDHLAGTLYVDRIVPRTFRSVDNLKLPLAAGVPQPGPVSPSK